MGQLANPSSAFTPPVNPEQATKDSEDGCKRQFPFVDGFFHAEPSTKDAVKAILVRNPLAGQGLQHGFTVQSLITAVSDNILANLIHDDPRIGKNLAALENLRKAVAVLNKRDERLGAANAESYPSERVPALLAG